MIPGVPGRNEFYIYDSEGILLHTIPTYDINDRPSTSVTMDMRGRIIIGMGCNITLSKTVSVHLQDGMLISKFETSSPPRMLTCAPDNRLVVSFKDNTLKVMDQSGRNAVTVQPPPGVTSWQPKQIRCSKCGELFVSGVSAVYRYMYESAVGEFQYQDCITMEHGPCKVYGIALSSDEEELFIVDRMSSVIKVFHRS